MIKDKGEFASLNRDEIDQIVNYYIQLKEKQELIFEAKVLVVGEPKAGKTTLTQKIIDNEKWVKGMKGKDSVQTVGIEIAKIPIPYHKDKSKEITAHFWDFGGQDIQYVLHQYFFTERSLYVLLADGRKELPNFNYWFEIIATLGRDCPVLVVLNENGGKPVKTFNITEFREQFGEHLECIEEESVNFYTDEDGRFETLKNKIHLKTSNLKQIGSPLPKKWVDVRKEIERLKDKNAYIEKDRFLEICNSFKLTNKDYQEQLRDYLHDLGIALNYKTDINLRNKFILKPNWVIDSLYVVLQDNKIEKDHGRFKVDYVEELWQKEGYSLKDCDLLLGLMQKGKFEIAYKINDNEFIVPILLPYKPEKDYRLEEMNEIRTEFLFKFMPKGIVPRLIVRLHKNIVSIDDKQIVWNKGVLLSHHDSIAEVVERDQSKQITIRVIGENIVHNKELLTIIRNEIHGIDRDWFENRLKFDEFVPCTCAKCKELKGKFESLSEPELKNLNENERKSLELEPYKLFELQDRLKRKKHTIECRKSYEDIPIKELLKDIYIIAETMENKESNVFNISDINGNVIIDSNIKNSTVKNLVKQSDNFEAIYKKLDEMFEKLNETQSAELKNLTDEFFTLIDEKLVKENKLSAEQIEAVNKAKYSSDTKLKLKVGLPFACLTGIDASIEHEFKMSKEIKADGVIWFLRKVLGHDDLQTISPEQLED
ncbi:MAG: ADP-ribosylation factor-like protein [Pyrinomonadaceae bacterium]|nr:ADP-ribosylation factor-like protein [Pyrinomonadaceae bacterium]